MYSAILTEDSQLANFQCILGRTEQWKHIPQPTIRWLVYLTRSTLLNICDSHGGYTHNWLGERGGSVVKRLTHEREVGGSKPRKQWLRSDMAKNC